MAHSVFGHLDDPSMGNEEPVSLKSLTQLEVNHTLTILYLLVEVGRRQDIKDEKPLIRQTFGKLWRPLIEHLLTRKSAARAEPDLLIYLNHTIAKFRWEESNILPLPRVSVDRFRFFRPIY